MGCSIFLQTAAGTLVGNVSSNIMLDDDKDKADDEKEKQEELADEIK